MFEFFFIQWGNTSLRVDVAEILSITVNGHRLEIRLADGKRHMPYLTLKEIEAELPAELFARVNRGTLVALNHVICFDKDTVYMPDVNFGFSEGCRETFRQKIRLIIHKEKR